MSELLPGLTGETEMIASEADTAARLGSGSVPVLGTPALMGLMEGAAVQALADHLSPGQTSVGGRIDVRHLAPTPVGMHIRARAELLKVEGRRLAFHIEAWDEVEQIGKATHERFVIDEKKFVANAQAKADASA
ncbi:MAG: thioesterase family protein [Chloroflexi bacterium]|nr:thioesterase family protein [Chloroflexota bacterium]